jgi:hypothetical protein
MRLRYPVRGGRHFDITPTSIYLGMLSLLLFEALLELELEVGSFAGSAKVL